MLNQRPLKRRKVEQSKSPPSVWIDPTQLDESHHAILRKLISSFEAIYSRCEFSAENFYTIEMDNTIINCHLKYSLAERGQKTSLNRKENIIHGRRFEVYATNTGEGSTCQTYRSLGTLIMRTDNTFIFKRKDKRIIKKYKDNVPFFKKQYEYDMSMIASHLNVKPIKSNILVMDYFPEQDLFNVICNDLDRVQILNLKDRFMYAIAICEAVIKQVHKKGLIHRDLKPENIRVYKNQTGKIVVNILDFDRAIRINDRETYIKLPIGTLYYTAPEDYYKKDIDQKSDVYSLGKIIAMLFRCITNNDISKEDILNEFRNGIKFDNRFEDIHGLENTDCEKLETIMYALLFPQEKRCTLRQAADELRYIYYTEIQGRLISALQDAFDNAVLDHEKSFIEKLINALEDTLYQLDETTIFTDAEIEIAHRTATLALLIEEYEDLGMLPYCFIEAKKAYLERAAEEEDSYSYSP